MEDCTGIRTGNDAQLKERESANDTHHTHSKTIGSRPGTSIDQNFVSWSHNTIWPSTLGTEHCSGGRRLC